MPLKVLIVGAGICGPALATLLRRSDPENSITVVERHPGIRHNGLQIDLRAWGVPIMKRLGLIDAVKEKCVHESGITFVDSKGKQHGLFGAAGTETGRKYLQELLLTPFLVYRDSRGIEFHCRTY